jgi:hypothetical protein
MQGLPRLRWISLLALACAALPHLAAVKGAAALPTRAAAAHAAWIASGVGKAAAAEDAPSAGASRLHGAEAGNLASFYASPGVDCNPGAGIGVDVRSPTSADACAAACLDHAQCGGFLSTQSGTCQLRPYVLGGGPVTSATDGCGVDTEAGATWYTRAEFSASRSLQSTTSSSSSSSTTTTTTSSSEVSDDFCLPTDEGAPPPPLTCADSSAEEALAPSSHWPLVRPHLSLGPLGLWLADDTVGAAPMTLRGLDYTDGLPTRGVVFADASQYGDVGNTTFGGALTIAFWTFTGNYPSDAPFFTFANVRTGGATVSASDVLSFTTNGQVSYTPRGAAEVRTVVQLAGVSTDYPALGHCQWTHLVVVIDVTAASGSTGKGIATIYMDGKPNTIAPLWLPLNTTRDSSWFGKAPSVTKRTKGQSVTPAFRGTLQDVMFFARALTPQEVLHIYHGCGNAAPPALVGLCEYFTPTADSLYSDCLVTLEPGAWLSAGTSCRVPGASCVKDTVVELLAADDLAVLMSNDDSFNSCGDPVTCSFLSYQNTATTAVDLIIHTSCYGSWTTCAAQPAWQIIQSSGTQQRRLLQSAQPPPQRSRNLTLDDLTADDYTSLVKLQLPEAGLTGRVPMINTPYLQYADLSHNKLKGTLPAELALLSSLTYLDVSSNELNGTLPIAPALNVLNVATNAFSNLLENAPPSCSLVHAVFDGNKAFSSVPDWFNVMCTYLKRIFLDDCNFTSASLPGVLTPSLVELSAARNQLTDLSTPGLGRLEALDLSDNNFSLSALPRSLLASTTLTYLDLHSCLLSGRIPSVPAPVNSAGETVYLKFLNLADNAFSGPIPTFSVDVKAGSQVFLNKNMLTSTIPVDLVLGARLLNVANNALNGTVPPQVGDSSLLGFIASDNFLSGTLPSTLFSARSLAICLLSDSAQGLRNNFICPLPKLPAACAGTVCSCPAGAVFNATLGFGDCQLCKSGAFSTFGSSTCQPCAVGSVSAAGSVSCTVCSAGSFANTTSNLCQACAPGSVSSAPGAPQCTACAAGSVASANATTCTPCHAGKFLNASSLLCEPCAVGSYSPLPGAIACIVNPAGFASKTETYFASSMSLPGVTALGASQNATLAAAVASAMDVSADSVLITGVSGAPPSAHRRLAVAAATANFTVTTTNTTLAAQVRTTLHSTPAFASKLQVALQASPDPVLAAVSDISVTAPTENTQVLSSEACQPGTFLNSLTASCDVCAWNLVSLSAGAVACSTCPTTSARANASYCQPCPDNSRVATSNPGLCACSNGFYDALFGADVLQPACKKCPIGGVCDTGFVAAAAGYWRETTLSDVFYRCREGKCQAETVIGPLSPPINTTVSTMAAGRRLLPLAGGNATNSSADTLPTNCVEGAVGPLCAVCLPGYALQSGECLPCDPADAWENWSAGSKTALLVCVIAAAVVFILFAFFQPLLPAVERFADACLEAAKSCFSATKSKVTCGVLGAPKEGADGEAKKDAKPDAAGPAADKQSGSGHSLRSGQEPSKATQSCGDVLLLHELATVPVTSGAAAQHESHEAAAGAAGTEPHDGDHAARSSAASRLHSANHHQHHSESGLVHHARHAAGMHYIAANAAFAVGMMSAAMDENLDVAGIGTNKMDENVGGHLDLLDLLKERVETIQKFAKIIVKCVAEAARASAYVAALTCRFSVCARSFYQIVST